MMRVPAEEQTFLAGEEVLHRRFCRQDVVPRLRSREVAMRKCKTILLMDVGAVLQPGDLIVAQLFPLRTVDVVVGDGHHLPHGLKSDAGGIVISHQHDVEVLSNLRQGRLDVIAVASHIAQQNILLATQTPRILQGHLQGPGVCVDVAHDGVFHYPSFQPTNTITADRIQTVA